MIQGCKKYFHTPFYKLKFFKNLQTFPLLIDNILVVLKIIELIELFFNKNQ
jgi:hypothetical protein